MDIPANVKAKIDATIEAEGGAKYTNDPTDRGGPTKYGITQTTYTAFGFSGDVKDATYEQAFEIYLKRYWYGPKFDKVEAISPELATELFDWGVTSGPARPAKALQRALNVFNRQGADFPDITADGAIGRMTLYALSAFVAKRGKVGLAYLSHTIEAQRAVFYIEVAEHDASQEKYVNGWIERTFRG